MIDKQIVRIFTYTYQKTARTIATCLVFSLILFASSHCLARGYEDVFGFIQLSETAHKLVSPYFYELHAEDNLDKDRIFRLCSLAAFESTNLNELYYIWVNMESSQDKTLVHDILQKNAQKLLVNNEARINAIKQLKRYMKKRDIIALADESIAAINIANKQIHKFLSKNYSPKGKP